MSNDTANTPNTIDLVPNYKVIFERYMEETERSGARLLRACSLYTVFDSPSEYEAITEKISDWRDLADFITSANVALCSITSVEDLRKFQELFAKVSAQVAEETRKRDAYNEYFKEADTPTDYKDWLADSDF